MLRLHPDLGSTARIKKGSSTVKLCWNLKDQQCTFRWPLQLHKHLLLQLALELFLWETAEDWAWALVNCNSDRTSWEGKCRDLTWVKKITPVNILWHSYRNHSEDWVTHVAVRPSKVLKPLYMDMVFTCTEWVNIRVCFWVSSLDPKKAYSDLMVCLPHKAWWYRCKWRVVELVLFIGTLHESTVFVIQVFTNIDASHHANFWLAGCDLKQHSLPSLHICINIDSKKTSQFEHVVLTLGTPLPKPNMDTGTIALKGPNVVWKRPLWADPVKRTSPNSKWSFPLRFYHAKAFKSKLFEP